MNDDKQQPFPPIPEAILNELNRRFPECCADLEWTEKQVWFFSGQRAVVRFLNHTFNQQREDSLGTGD
jgi:Ni,Fe-hydrogenase III component G